jgi:hypothetical protein
MSFANIVFLGGLVYYLYKKKAKYADIVVYVIFLTLLLKIAMPTEKADMMCPQGPHTKNKSLCREGNGKLFRYGKISNKDSISDLTIKLNKLIDDKNTQVYWRRFFIMSFLLCLTLHYVLFESLPSGSRMVVMIIVCFFFLLNFHSFYHFHYNKLFDDKIKAISRRIYLIEKKKTSASN